MNSASRDRRDLETHESREKEVVQDGGNAGDPIHSAPPHKSVPQASGFSSPSRRLALQGRQLLCIAAVTACAFSAAHVTVGQQSTTDPVATGQTQLDAGAAGQTQPPGQSTLGNDALDSQTPNALNNQPSDNASALQNDRSDTARERSVIGESNRYEQPRILDDRGANDDIDRMAPPLDRETRGDQPMDRAAGRGELGVFLIDSDGPGVRIRSVVSGSAAEAAGLEAGDVILAVDGEEVMSPSQVADRIRNRAAGEEAMLQIWRDGNQQDVAARLQAPRSGEYRVGYRGDTAMDESAGASDRTRELERRLDLVMDELAQLRAEVRRIQGARTGAPMVQPTLPPGDSGGLRGGGGIGGETSGSPAGTTTPTSPPSSVPGSALPTATPPSSTAPGAGTPDGAATPSSAQQPGTQPATTNNNDSLFE